MHKGPISARQHPPLGLGHLTDITGAIGTGVKNHLPLIRALMPREAIEQRGLT